MSRQIKVISVCKTDCNSKVYGVVTNNNGKQEKVVTYNKVTKKGWGMYVEISTLPNGKKTSVTRHGEIPKT